MEAPREIENEISNINQPNLFVEDCPENSIEICFDGFDCDINVNMNQKSVEKEGELVYFETDALMYGAIFSDEEIYECQVQRLMKRLKELSFLYNEKSTIISFQGCPIETDVLSLASASNIQSSEHLVFVKNTADDIDIRNKGACKLW